MDKRIKLYIFSLGICVKLSKKKTLSKYRLPFSEQTYKKLIALPLTWPTEETPLSVLPHREYCNSFLSPNMSLVLSRALKSSPCMKKPSACANKILY